MDFDPEAKTVVGLSIGQQIFGRFSLDRVLGQGAMGVVWLANDSVMGEQVALKFLPPVLAADPAALEEMKEEARQSRRLTHEHIVRIHDLVTDDQMAAISMEWVDGMTLSTMRLKRPGRFLEVEDLAPLLVQIAQALDYAHRRARVVHRDLKPSNIMVTQDGFVKITDFGIARSLTDSVTRLTRANTSGTPSYMSPQQMMGKRPAPEDDIYALGATLYELLTGKPPFYTGDLGMQVLHAAPPTLVERRRELGVTGAAIPDFWEEGIRLCLIKNPEERPSSAGALLELLQINPETPVAPLSAILPESAPLADVAGTSGSLRGSRSSRGGERTRQQFAELVKAGKFREAATLLLSPLLDEQESDRLGDQLAAAVAKEWEQVDGKLTALIREEQFSEARTLLREWRSRVPPDLAETGFDGLEGMLVQVSDHGDLAEAGAWSELGEQRKNWSQAQRTPGLGAVVEEVSDTVIFEHAMHRAEALLLEGKLSHAYRHLEGLRDSGLCGAMTQNLAARLEKIRAQSNAGIERELDDLEAQARASTLSEEALNQWISGIRKRYLPDPSGNDPLLGRLAALERRDPPPAEPPPLPADKVASEPPPLPPRAAAAESGAGLAAEPPPLKTVSSVKTEEKEASGWGVLVWVPILALLLVGAYFGGYRPYEQGMLDVVEIQSLLDSGQSEDAELLLMDLESRLLTSWLLAPSIRELRAHFGDLDGLAERANLHPGLRVALSEFRKIHPNGPIRTFRGNWEDLKNTVQTSEPGTVLFLETDTLVPTTWIGVESPIAIIGAAGKTRWVVDMSYREDPVMEFVETEALIAGIEVSQAENDETEAMVFYLENSMVWMASVTIDATTMAGLLANQSTLDGRDLTLTTPGGTGLSLEGAEAHLVLRQSDVIRCDEGLVLKEGATGRVESVLFFENSKLGAGAINAGSHLELVDCQVIGNHGGLAAVSSARLDVRDTTIKEQSDFGLLVDRATGYFDFCEITDNEIGIILHGMETRAELKSITVSGNNSNGMWVGSGARGVVVRSDFTQNGDNGVQIQDDGSVLEFSDTNFSRNRMAGLQIDGRSRALAENSVFRANREGGLVASESQTKLILLNARVDSNEKVGVVAQSGAQVEILDSQIYDNNGSGLRARGSATGVVLTRTSLLRNKGFGVEKLDGAEVAELEALKIAENQSGARNN